MAIVAFASAKGSPGVTTTVAALAATWPAERDLVIAELDPSGGDLVVRFDLAVEPGLVTLAAAGRRELGPGTLLAHTQPLPVEAGEAGPTRRVLVGPVSAEQAGASLAALRGGLAPALDALGVDVLVDCGRLDPGSPAHDVAIGADLLVMVARPVVAGVHHLAARVASTKARSVAVLLVGDRPYSVSEVAATVGADPLGTLPVDSRAASALTGGHPSAVRLLRRSHLLRDARALSEVLAAWLPHTAPAPRPPPPQQVQPPHRPPPPPSHRPSTGQAPPVQQPPPPPQPPPHQSPPRQPPPVPAQPGHVPPDRPSHPQARQPNPASPVPARPGPLSAPVHEPPDGADAGTYGPATPAPGSPMAANGGAPAGTAAGAGRRAFGRGAPKHFRRDDVEETRR